MRKIQCNSVLDGINVENLTNVGISEPVEKIINDILTSSKNSDTVNLQNSHDYWTDQPRHEHYNDTPSK
ncbi:hypothetical protein D4R87_02885 [bacterium]|nr:MAG: hypothetical protein D4R87_02885 [bacterium]